MESLRNGPLKLFDWKKEFGMGFINKLGVIKLMYPNGVRLVKKLSGGLSEKSLSTKRSIPQFNCT